MLVALHLREPKDAIEWVNPMMVRSVTKKVAEEGMFKGDKSSDQELTEVRFGGRSKIVVIGRADAIAKSIGNGLRGR